MNVTAVMVFFMLIGLIGYFLLGYLLGKYHKEQEQIQKVSKQAKMVSMTPAKPGVIDYPTQEDIDYTESGEEKVDQAREELFKQYFTN